MMDRVYIVFEFRGAIKLCTVDEDRAARWVADQPLPDDYFIESFELLPTSD